ncbi:sugar ABC transporter substrate-binding protein [Nonomuraea sp. NN258]|uniref:ABC transporter substrate-binding protein n=1 Tax=Nonomuraea antri TaxID=2730852 RepID=UPI00156869D5|nr:sugar ABC transporter substrate-binding protein [Nonomuraea antri]NRQ32761.1 sugar ABC transporter substrate-binding protein [Nonomuraea antri]
MRTPLIRLIAVVAGAAALAAGCGSGGRTPAQGGGKAEITLWQQKFTDQEDAWYKKAVAAFNKAQNQVVLKHVIVPADVWDQKMKAAQAARKAPDVYTVNYSKVPGFARTGQIQALDQLIPADKWAGLREPVVGSVRYQGRTYAYPMLVEPSTVLYYRKDLFAKAGLDPARPPATWQEVIDYGRKLTTKDVAGFVTAANQIDLGWSTWGLQLNAAGHLPISDDWSAPRAADPKYKQLLQVYQTLYQQGIMPKEPLAPYADANPLGQGKTAMMVCGSWAASVFLSDYPNLVPQIGAAALPSFDGDATKPTATLGGWTLAVDARSRNAKAAADFVSWLLAGDTALLTEFFRTTKFSKYSPRAAVADAINGDPAAAQNPWAKTIEEQVVKYAKPEPSYDWAISLAFGKAMEQAMQGKDVDQALRAADAEIKDLIAKNDLAGQGS